MGQQRQEDGRTDANFRADLCARYDEVCKYDGECRTLIENGVSILIV
jgi:hypothetical protein